MKVDFLFPEGKGKALTFSYDDGRVFDRQLVEMFNKYGLRGTFHLNSGKLGQAGYVIAEEAASLYAGHEVSSHSLTHPFLDRISQQELLHEVLQDRSNLEKLVKYPVCGMSYPYGAYSSNVVEALRSCGVVYSRTVQATGGFSLPDDFLHWHPGCHHSGAADMVTPFLQTQQNLSVFYIWGHSYEFDNDGSWDKMDELCRMLGGRSNIWYASNIELYRYITALRGMEISCDRHLYRNNASETLWLRADEKVFSIAPGAVLEI